MWHPSVELLGRTALECCDPARLVAVMLTGMGYDGADAFTEIKKLGGRTIAESEESAVVFGMPAELIKRGGASVVLPAEKVAEQLNTWTRR
jgi:two-component system chemotaxis response regulator CheB